MHANTVLLQQHQVRRGRLQGLQDRGVGLRRLLSAVSDHHVSADGKKGHAFADCATVDTCPNGDYWIEADNVCQWCVCDADGVTTCDEMQSVADSASSSTLQQMISLLGDQAICTLVT